MKRIGYLTTSAVLAVALMISATPAQAAVQSTEAHSTSAATRASERYSDADVVKFFFFGTGPIASARPDLVKALNIPSQPSVPDSVVKLVVDGLKSVDPAFHANVTLNAQAGDPYKAEAAFKNLVADAKALSDKMSSTQAPASSAARATANGIWYAFANVWLSTTVVATAGLAVSVVAVAGALVVFAYQEPSDTSDLVSQNFAAALSTL